MRRLITSRSTCHSGFFCCFLICFFWFCLWLCFFFQRLKLRTGSGRAPVARESAVFPIAAAAATTHTSVRLYSPQAKRRDNALRGRGTSMGRKEDCAGAKPGARPRAFKTGAPAVHDPGKLDGDWRLGIRGAERISLGWKWRRGNLMKRAGLSGS